MVNFIFPLPREELATSTTQLPARKVSTETRRPAPMVLLPADPPPALPSSRKVPLNPMMSSPELPFSSLVWSSCSSAFSAWSGCSRRCFSVCPPVSSTRPPTSTDTWLFSLELELPCLSNRLPSQLLFLLLAISLLTIPFLLN